MSNVFPVPDHLGEKYQGAGHALAASLGGELVDLVYIRDVLDDFDPDEPDALARAIDDARLGPTVRRLQSLGAVHVGMASSWEFIEL